MRIILASQSPRRKELLNLMNVKYEVIVSNVDEKLEKGITIEDQVKRLSYIKAKAVFDETIGDRVVIGADTMVFKDGKIYGKPKDEEDAKKMLFKFKNSNVKVITGLSVLVEDKNKYKEYIDYDIADIYIKDMQDEEIEKWIKTGEALDKAGAFAIQSGFSVFIEKIIGNYTTIVGLQIHKLYDYIKEYCN